MTFPRCKLVVQQILPAKEVKISFKVCWRFQKQIMTARKVLVSYLDDYLSSSVVNRFVLTLLLHVSTSPHLTSSISPLIDTLGSSGSISAVLLSQPDKAAEATMETLHDQVKGRHCLIVCGSNYSGGSAVLGVCKGTV